MDVISLQAYSFFPAERVRVTMNILFHSLWAPHVFLVAEEEYK